MAGKRYMPITRWKERLYTLGEDFEIDKDFIAKTIFTVETQSPKDTPKILLYERAWRKLFDKM